MRPFYWHSANFGDHLNSWLWRELLGEMIDEQSDIRLVGVGSLLKKELSHVKGRKVVIGSGAGYGAIPTSEEMANWKVTFVRGPLTAKALGLEPTAGVVDGAWLISLLDEFKSLESGNDGGARQTVFIPHWSSAKAGSWKAICDQLGIQYVDPLANSKDVIKTIAGAGLAVTEALHGAIVADYYRVPWIPLKISPEINDFKWLDWCMSVGLNYRPIQLPYSDAIEQITHGHFPRRAPADVVLRFQEVPETVLGRAARDPGGHKLYVKMQKLKTVLSPVKTRIKDDVLRVRHVWPVSAWNRSYMAAALATLQRAAGAPPCLSRDHVRQSKIDQIAEIVGQLKSGYFDF